MKPKNRETNHLYLSSIIQSFLKSYFNIVTLSTQSLPSKLYEYKRKPNFTNAPRFGLGSNVTRWITPFINDFSKKVKQKDGFPFIPCLYI